MFWYFCESSSTIPKSILSASIYYNHKHSQKQPYLSHFRAIHWPLRSNSSNSQLRFLNIWFTSLSKGISSLRLILRFSFTQLINDILHFFLKRMNSKNKRLTLIILDVFKIIFDFIHLFIKIDTLKNISFLEFFLCKILEDIRFFLFCCNPLFVFFYDHFYWGSIRLVDFSDFMWF